VTLQLVGEIDPLMGWFIDFGDLEEAVRPVIAQLDHYLLNDIEGLSNPTSEIVAEWIYWRLAPQLLGLNAVRVSETADSSATFRPV
jgi:6-pyruvoyltetrahydropterin/6-carboxytetrahydropterin synthase